MPLSETLLADFPILDQSINGRRLVYLDNAATTQKPVDVLNVMRYYYESFNANIHRGTHQLARHATDAYEQARQKIAAHLHAADPAEVIFTSGTTDGINLAAQVLAISGRIKQDDEILLSALEHHSNIVPWQMLCERTGAKLVIIPCHDDGTLDQTHFASLLSERTKVLAISWVSNAFGTVNPIAEMANMAKAVGALVLIDAAQAIPHLAVNVQSLDIDFLAFSGHKVYAPTGTGVLWGRKELLDALPPWRGGGEMIREVTFEKTTYNDLPFKFEAGTPNIGGAIALGSAFDYLNQIGLDAVAAHESSLIQQTANAIRDLPGLRLYGPEDRVGALSFTIEGIHHYDLGTLLDQMGVAVRTGHHCCQPLMTRFGMTGTIRASFALYNNNEDVEIFVESLKKALSMLR